MVGITRPCVKHNFLVQGYQGSGRHHQEGLPYRQYRPSRPGCRRCPEDVTAQVCEFRLSADGADALLQSGGEGTSGADQEGRATPADARRPIIYVGGGGPLGCLRQADEAGASTGLSVTNT